LFLVVLTYLIPLGVTYCVDPEMKHWHDGHFSVISRMVGGEWLGITFVIGAVLSGSAQFLAEMASDSYQLWGMSKWGMLPKTFGKMHHTYETPWPSILMSLAALLPVTLLELGDIVQIENTFYSMSLALECLSAVVLRYREPTLKRPFSIPLSPFFLGLYLLFPVGLGVFSMIMCDRLTWIVTGCVSSVGVLGYLLLRFGKKYQWFVFETILTLDHLKKNPNEQSPDTPIRASPVPDYGSINLQDQDHTNTTDQENRNKYE